MCCGSPVAGISHVQRQAEALALLHDQSVAEACVWILLRDGTRLGFGVGEQQVVGDVLVARGTLLRQVVSPAQCLQQRAHQLLLGSRLMQVGRAAELSEFLTRRLVESGERFRFCDGALPFWRSLDAVRQEILGEQLAGHVGSLEGIHVTENRHLATQYRYTVIRNCMPSARVIRTTVAKLGLPFSDSALQSPSRLIPTSRAKRLMFGARAMSFRVARIRLSSRGFVPTHRP